MDLTPRHERISNFLSECLEVKKSKYDLEPVIVRKRAELHRINGQIGKLKSQMLDLTRRLNAKELVADALNIELATLYQEWNSSTE